MRLVFPRKTGSLVYGSALLEDQVFNYPIEKFDFEKDRIYLPAPDGLIGIDEGMFLIKHNETVHVAWEFSASEKTVALRMLRPPNGDYHWVVSIVKGTADAVMNEVRRINTFPPVVF